MSKGVGLGRVVSGILNPQSPGHARLYTLPHGLASLGSVFLYLPLSTPKCSSPHVSTLVSFPPLFPASPQPQLTTQHSLTTCGEVSGGTIPALTLRHPPRTEDSALHSWRGWSSEPGSLGGFEGTVKSVSSMGPAGVCGLWHQIDP